MTNDPYLRWRNLAWSVPAVRQNTPETCWCAALAWWAAALNDGRPKLNQDKIYWNYSMLLAGQTDNYIPPRTLIRVWSEPQWKVAVSGRQSGISQSTLATELRYGPMMLAYRRAADSIGHVVVVVAPSLSQTDKFMVMDPAIGNVQAWGYGRFSGNYVLVGAPRQ